MFEYPMNPSQMPYQPAQSPFGMGGINNMQQSLGSFNRPQMPYQPTQQQTPQSNMDWIRVNTMEDVKNINIQPSTKAWIMLSSEPIFVLKQADGMGITTTEAYRFEKVTDDSQKAPDYITREELYKILDNYTKPSKPTQTTQKGADK